MSPFYGGNKTRPRINVTTGAKAFNWFFDTGAAITCMSVDSFKDAFKTTRPRLLKQDQKCMAANGSKLNSLGVFEIPMTIPGRNFLHPVAVMEDIKDNIIGIDFMHAIQMNYDTTSKPITFSHMLTNELYAINETTIPALSSLMINTKFKGTVFDSAQLIATIHAPSNPTITSVPSWVKLGKYKNCKLVIDNCAQFDITLARNEVLGDLEFEQEFPLTESTIASVISDIHKKFPKVLKKSFS